MNKAYIIAIAVIGIALGFTMWAMSSGMTPYVDIKTARVSNTAAQVRGLILRDEAHPVRRDSQLNAFRFWIKDAQKDEIEVVYYGAKPDAFDTAPGTAAHGFVRKENGKDVFIADSLIIQCPSKYQDQKSVYKTAAAGS